MRLFFSLLSGAVLFAASAAAEQTGQTEPDATADMETENIYDPLHGVPAPLADALRSFGRDANRWAYTARTITRNRRGKVVQDQVARYDPSLHYDEQWTLLQQGGEAATDKQVEEHRKLKLKLDRKRKSFGELLELKKAVELPGSPGGPGVIVYAVPLSREGNGRFPVDKVEVLVRVSEAGRELLGLEMRLREAVRAAGVAKVKSGTAVFEFVTPLAESGPAIARVKLDLAASLLLFPIEQHTEEVRTEFQRVTPYDDRFTVKPGPLKMIDF